MINIAVDPNPPMTIPNDVRKYYILTKGTNTVGLVYKLESTGAHAYTLYSNTPGAGFSIEFSENANIASNLDSSAAFATTVDEQTALVTYFSNVEITP